MQPTLWHLAGPRDAVPPLFSAADLAALRQYVETHARVTTPLRRAKGIATRIGLRNLRLKDETDRDALPSFKVLGAGFAIAQLLARGALAPGATVVCASEGNHGRAVARAARRSGLKARVYVGARVAEERAEAIALEGAVVVRVAGSYDDAVRAATRDAATEGATVVSDTSWDGYTEIPRLIMLGYLRLMDEAAAKWKTKAPDVVVVPGGVGGLAASVASWYALNPDVPRARLVVVEPLRAACLQASARAGAWTAVPGPHETIMGGLRCGEPSPLAWPAVQGGFDAYVAIDDGWVREAMRLLARPPAEDRPVAVGASGAAGVGALLAMMQEPALVPLREALGLGRRTRALALLTEGVTEPSLYEAVVGGGGRARQR